MQMSDMKRYLSTGDPDTIAEDLVSESDEPQDIPPTNHSGYDVDVDMDVNEDVDVDVDVNVDMNVDADAEITSTTTTTHAERG